MFKPPFKKGRLSSSNLVISVGWNIFSITGGVGLKEEDWAPFSLAKAKTHILNAHISFLIYIDYKISFQISFLCYINTNVLFTLVISAYLFMWYIYVCMYIYYLYIYIHTHTYIYEN